MQYTVAHLDLSSLSDYQRDLLFQELADIGFETFDGDDAYIQTALLDESALSALARALSQASVPEFVEGSLEPCPDENWNAVWESEHEVEELPLGVRIIPHCAFGAGHHETTRMMIDALLELSESSEPSTVGELDEFTAAQGQDSPCSLFLQRSGPCSSPQMGATLDMGCGTGVLAIFAAKLGAAHVLAVDIDEHSVANTLENAELNGVTVEAVEAGVVPSGAYDLILANIHRNILLDQLPDYARYLNAGGHLLMSGFYETDIPALLDAATALGLSHFATRQSGDWRMLHFTK